MEKGLILNTSYNEFFIGTHISNYFYKRYEEGEPSEDPWEDGVCFDFYDDGVTIWCVNNIIETISCHRECIYDGINLIGMNFNEFLNRFHFSPDDEDIIWLKGAEGKNGQNQHVYDFDKEGLQIWVWRNKIRTIIITDYSKCVDLLINKSYEEFDIHAPISNYFYKKYEELATDVIHPFKRYKFVSPEVEIWCWENMIDTIVCTCTCIYENTNLVGLGYNTFLKMFGVISPESKQIYIDTNGRKELRHVYEFDELGLQLWVWHKKIKTILVYNAQVSKLNRTMITNA